MIVDCHTQVWDERKYLEAGESTVIAPGCAAETQHLEALNTVDRAIVLAFKSNYLHSEVPNELVSEYVRRHAPKLIGFAGVDPTDETCLEDIRQAQEGLGLKGVTVSPPLQNYHPCDTRAMRVYEDCARRGMPILFEQNHRSPAAKLEFARPMLLDEVAREYPELRTIVAHVGYPWVDETVVLLAKHPNVYADVSGILSHPWICYNALLAAYEYGVMEKLLFGSDYPYISPAEGIEALYSINQLSIGSNLVAIPREKLRGIVERDTLSLLGIEASAPRPSRPVTNAFVDEE